VIGLERLLPAHLIDSHDERLSVLCVRTAELKYLIFSAESTMPLYVVQSGPQVELSNTYTTTSRLHGLLKDRIPEPLHLSVQEGNRAVLVQRGLAGKPWFNLQTQVQDFQSWNLVKNLAVESLRELHTASESQSDWNLTLNIAALFDELRKRCEQIIGQSDPAEQKAYEMQRSRLASLEALHCYRQHGDFCVNNLMFQKHQAGIGSLLALHPQRDEHTDESLWRDIIQGSTYESLLSQNTVEALFVLSLMWWIVETDGKKQREPMARRYKAALQQALRDSLEGIAWVPGRTTL